ncbi:MAG: ribosome maturation factor RimM [Melioribacteraceae bacterium]|nr:ribosome maturation factor RimM [Melioribacteraceae bacterium]
MDQFILVAKIVALHGSDGFVVIDSYSDYSERFYDLNTVFIEFFGNKKEFSVEEVNKIRGKFLLKLRGFNSADDAKIFIGKKIFVDKKNSVELNDDSYFIHDLMECEVYNGKVLLGSVEDVLILPANDVYVVKCPDKRKILIPAIKDYIKKIDPVKKRIDLVPDCDLLYDDEN